MKKIFFLLLFSGFIFSINSDLSNQYCQRVNYSSICDFSYANNSDSGVGAAVFKNSTPFNPKNVFPGNTIFVTGHSIDNFFREVDPLIEHPYILLCLYGGLKKEYLDNPHVIACFANDSGGPDDPNAIHLHEKVTMLPIGLSRDERLHHENDALNQAFESLRTKQKTKLLYMNFSLHHWAHWRHKLYNDFKDKPFVGLGSKKPFMGYMQDMSDYKFALSPSGDMYDCYRHWEAIMVGTIPIILKHYPVCEILKDLPVLIVNEWDELTENFLEKKYVEITSKEYDLSKLYLKYWVEKINMIKDTYLSSHFTQKERKL